MRFSLGSVVLGALIATVSARTYCSFGDSTCWPTTSEIAALNKSLSAGTRQLYWAGGDAPRNSPFPYGSPNDQPLYGLGASSLHPVYTRDLPANTTCFMPSASPYVSEFCLAATRNAPKEGYNPGLIVWPLNAADVSKAVWFAIQHNMCIMVAGTGHDFLNRHSCKDGMFIRTALLKSVEWDLTDSKGFGWADGNVKFGSGIVFSEAQKAASEVGRYVSSGWAATVGIIGWSIGGGHGPYAETAGLGVDNILEVEFVASDGYIYTANQWKFPDIFWAIRGGGGSTWGVITAITVRAHKLPADGLTFISISHTASMCDEVDGGLTLMDNYIDFHKQWMLKLDQRFSGYTYFTPSYNSTTGAACNASWSLRQIYVFTGNNSDGMRDTMVASLMTSFPQFTYSPGMANDSFSALEQQGEPDPLIPVDWNDESLAGSVPSVLLQRNVVANGSLAASMKKHLRICKSQSWCARLELYQDITGNLDSPQVDLKQVSISPAFRTAFIHMVVGEWTQQQMLDFYTLGESSYFSESAYNINGWQQRYWGSNYWGLVDVKRNWDPNDVFACRHCVDTAWTTQ